MGKTSIDERGRIIIPKELRKKLGLKPKQNMIIEARGNELVLRPALKVEEFSAELKGCIHGSRIKPSKLKEIWDSRHVDH